VLPNGTTKKMTVTRTKTKKSWVVILPNGQWKRVWKGEANITRSGAETPR